MLRKFEKKKIEFSKLILLLETVIICFLTYWVMYYVGLSIQMEFDGSFPYLTTMVSCAYAAYGTSVAFYYNKAKLENLIKLEKLYGKESVAHAEREVNKNPIKTKYPTPYYTGTNNYYEGEDLSSDDYNEGQG